MFNGGRAYLSEQYTYFRSFPKMTRIAIIGSAVGYGMKNYVALNAIKYYEKSNEIDDLKNWIQEIKEEDKNDIKK